MVNKIIAWWRERKFAHLKSRQTQDIFSEIYKKNIWGGEPGAFFSGTGTHNLNTAIYKKCVVEFIRQNQIRSITEIGCGDFAIMKDILSHVDVDYTGGDIVPDLIEHLTKNFENSNTKFTVLNAIEDPLPLADLVIIRQVLQHLNNKQIQEILAKIGDYKYALITEHIPVAAHVNYNLDKISGPHIRMRFNSGVFIDKAPFNCKNVSVLVEYPQDDVVKNKTVPAVIRTYLIRN